MDNKYLTAPKGHFKGGSQAGLQPKQSWLLMPCMEIDQLSRDLDRQSFFFFKKKKKKKRGA